MNANHHLILVTRPHGMLRESDFLLRETSRGAHGFGELVARTLYLSVDPYLRARMNEGAGSFGPDTPLQSNGLALVEESDDPRFRRGDIIAGILPWAEHAVLRAGEVRMAATYGAPLTSALGLLGLTGLTAYFGILEIGRPCEGETALVSAAAGAVGSIAGQIARIRGCKTVGIVGSEEKIDVACREFGFGAAVNYKNKAFPEMLADACPHGVDLYFDNVGGVVTDAALRHINHRARIVICGQISHYNAAEPLAAGPRPFPLLLAKSAGAQAFMVNHFADRFEQARIELATWWKDGLIHHRETVVEGLDRAAGALVGLFKGENIGKLLVRVSEPPLS
jgi:NADPH-dependent curcumin reductase CurA